MQTPSALLTVRQVAARLAISPSLVYRLVEDQLAAYLSSCVVELQDSTPPQTLRHPILRRLKL